MSWLFSQALVAEYSAANCLAGEPSAPLSVMPTPHKFWRNDKTMEPSKLSQFGLTCAVLTEDHGEELLTSFLAASRARTLASQEKERDSPALAQDYGKKWHGSFSKWDHSSFTWKTAQLSLLGDLMQCSVTWPKWGLMRNGECWERTTLAHHISVNVSGLLPTPTANNYGSNQSKSVGAVVRPSLQQMAKQNPWPTPKAPDGSKGGPNQKGSKGDLTLSSAVHRWPTPKANNAEKRGNIDPNNPRNGLAGAVRKFATPTARDSRSGIFSPAAKEARDQQSRGKPLNEQIGGMLNPTWVEWLMGWPLGWTDLRPLEMDKFQKWQQHHGHYSPTSSEIKEASYEHG